MAFLMIPKTRLAVLAFTLLLCLENIAAGDSRALEERFVTMAIQGDLSEAAALFVDPKYRGEPGADELRARYEARFHKRPVALPDTPDQDFLDGVADAYRDYWRRGLTGDEPGAMAVLERRLESLLEYGQENVSPGADVFSRLHSAFADRPVHFYESPGQPLRDLFLWTGQTGNGFTVRLTDRTLRLRVNFIEGFLLQGWKDFASLGLATTTGWVENGELYCLAGAYETDSERFQVSYLKHEARHLADLERYPLLDSTELEYRAKLTELAFAGRSLGPILDDFTEKAVENDASPHAMANWRVVRDVHWELYRTEMPAGFTRWNDLDTARINRIARALLAMNTTLHEGGK